MKTCIVYMRASTNEQKQANSIEIQKSVIQDYCERNEFHIVDLVFEYQSGRVDRPVFNDALKRCLLEGHLLVSLSPDRCSRNMNLFAQLDDDARNVLRFVNLGPEAPNMTVLAVLVSIAQAEALATSARVKASYKYLKSINPDHNWGKHSSHIRVAEMGREENTRLANVHNERIQSLVSGFRSQGLSLAQIVSMLDELNIKTRRGKKYSAANLYRVMRAA